jgi:hypothetical protein
VTIDDPSTDALLAYKLKYPNQKIQSEVDQEINRAFRYGFAAALALPVHPRYAKVLEAARHVSDVRTYGSDASIRAAIQRLDRALSDFEEPDDEDA